MPFVTVSKHNSADIQIYCKDWGSDQPVVANGPWQVFQQTLRLVLAMPVSWAIRLIRKF